MRQKRSKQAGTSSNILNYISIKPKVPKINDPPNSQELFVLSSKSDIVGNYEHFSIIF